MNESQQKNTSAADQERLNRNSSVITDELRQWWVLGVVNPLEEFFIRRRIRPNHITASASVMCVVVAYLYAQGYIMIAGWAFILMGSMDILDGRIARRTNQVSQAGGFLDSVMDRYQDFIVYAGLAYFYQNSWTGWMVLALILGSFMVSYARAKAEALGLEIKTVGTMQRPERIFLLGFGSIVSGFVQISLRPFVGHAEMSYFILEAIIIGMAVMTNYSAIQRIRVSMAGLSNQQEDTLDETQ